MKWKQAACVLLMHVAVTAHTAAQPVSANRDSFKQTKLKAERGDVDAQYSLGLLFDEGKEILQDYSEAANWYRKAADQNHAWAQNNLGVLYYFGRGVMQDYTEAARWYRKAADRNAAVAQAKLGLCYATGEGVMMDPVEAVKWYRKAAEQGFASAQFFLAGCYSGGKGVGKDEVEAVKWYRKAAEQNNDAAQCVLATFYAEGKGVPKDEVEAVKWYRKAAEQDNATAQHNLGNHHYNGEGVKKDPVEAAKWYRKAAEQNFALSQYDLGLCYAKGEGIPQNDVEAYVWLSLSAAQGYTNASQTRDIVARRMSREEVVESQRRASAFVPRRNNSAETDGSNGKPSPTLHDSQLKSSGTGFFINGEGLLITNEHLIKDGSQVRLVTAMGFLSAKVVKVDAANDLALLKAEGRFASLPIVPSRTAKLGSTVATVGFPNIGLQGFAPKLAKGEIASLSGAGDDARYFQISVPVQPGNSGGALVDERGNVVGVVSAKLNAGAALRSSGALPENVNYAVKSSYLLSFLESVPEVAAKLKEPQTKEKKFEDMVKEAEQAAVLVLVY